MDPELDLDLDLEAPLLGNRREVGDNGLPENAHDKSQPEDEWGLDLEAASNTAIECDERRPPSPNLDSNQPDHGRLKIGANLIRESFTDIQGSSPGAREYYRKQREAIAGFEEVDSTVASAEEPAEDLKKKNRETFAITLSNMCNVFLLMVKVFAAVDSLSLAIVASTLDSLLDLLAGLVLWLTRIAMRDKNPYKYPIGKLRVQPVGIIVFACIMATLGLQVLLTGVKQLLEQDAAAAHMGHMERIYVTVVMSTAIILKLALYLYCRAFDNEIVAAYAQDHYFDIITNLVGLTAALVASRFLWWLDPVGAIILALYTIIVWSKTVLENAVSLVGKSASPELLQKVTYMACRHHPQVQKIRTVRAYTVGTFFFVEVDLEVADDLPLRDARNIAQSLQERLETLREVERAFVHPYASFHRPDPVKAEPSPSLHKAAPSKSNSEQMECLDRHT